MFSAFFRQGFYDFMKEASATRLPVLPCLDHSAEERPSWKDSVEIAAKQVFGIEDPQPIQQYGVLTTRPGTKQQLVPYASSDPRMQNTVNSLEKKWSTPGTKAQTVGSARRIQNAGKV